MSIPAQKLCQLDHSNVFRDCNENVIATLLTSNPLSEDFEISEITESFAGSPCICWSGTLADSLIELHPHNWMGPGAAALAEFCDRLCEPLTQTQRTLCFRPHARHILSDIQSCLRFLRDRASEPFEIALEPAALLEPSMIGAAEDHLTRAFETLGDRCAVVILSDCVLSADGESVERVSSGQGILPQEHLKRLIDECIPPRTPICFPEQ